MCCYRANPFFFFSFTIRVIYINVLNKILCWFFLRGNLELIIWLQSIENELQYKNVRFNEVTWNGSAAMRVIPFFQTFMLLRSVPMACILLISSAWFCELNSQLRQWFPLMYLILYACIFLFSHWKTFVILCRVLDNLKDYAVRALVNAVDHLGTVAYKLTDLLEQQTSDVSTMELRVSCMNQVNFPEWIWCYMISNK